MKSILFLNENPLPAQFTKGTISGKELRLRAAVDELDEVHAVSLPGKAVENNDGSIGRLEKKIKIHNTTGWPYYLSPIILFVYGFYYVRRLKPAIIEAESPILSGIAAVLLGKIFHLPVLVEVRASYEELIKMKLTFIPLQLKRSLLGVVQKWMFANADIIVSNSKTYQRKIKKMGFESVVINPGLQYAPLGQKPPLLSRNKIICYLGRLVDEKGIDDLLNAVNLIKEYLINNKWKVWIVGDGIRRQSLEKLSKKLDLDDLISFRGNRANYDTLAKVQILVNPCFVKHPLEMVNVEAAIMEVPVVCYGDKTIPETVVDKKTGLKVPFRDVGSLSKTIKYLVSNPKLRNELGSNGIRLAEANYKFSFQVKKLGLVYKKLGVFS